MKQLARCLMVHLKDEQDKARMMEMPDLTVNGVKLTFQWSRKPWDSDKVFQYVAEELRLQQEA